MVQRGREGLDGADALINQIVSAIQQLAEWPARGAVPPELEAQGNHVYRQLSVPPFRVIYRPQVEGENRYITVVIVADARRDFRTLLDERLLGKRWTSDQP